MRDRLTRLEALQGFRVDTLGRFRDRIDDRDNPVSEGEMEQFKHDIREKMPVDAQAERRAAPTAIDHAAIQPVAALVRDL